MKLKLPKSPLWLQSARSFLLHMVGKVSRWLGANRWAVGLFLIGVTIVFGFFGFIGAPQENGDGENNFLDASYRAIALLGIQTGAVSGPTNWCLEIGRWAGMIFWLSAITAVVMQLFQDTISRSRIRYFTRKHVIVAGLGDIGARLVRSLLSAKRCVVVIEPDRNHPALEQCRAAGAVVITGQPDDRRVLKAARLDRASELIALFSPPQNCVRVATTAFDMLHSSRVTDDQPAVRCTLRLVEPGLLDVVRQHVIHTDKSDRFNLQILNSHEIAATTMVREAVANSRDGAIKRILVLGLGSHHRLGEMVVLRAARDHYIWSDGKVKEKLQIDVYDSDAKGWLEAFASRQRRMLEEVCSITPYECWARKHGASAFGTDYDAAFVCIADEGHAISQAHMLRREVLRNDEPIMVRVTHTKSGFGRLIEFGHEAEAGGGGSGWGNNIHAVGLDDSIIDPHMAIAPEIELRAQTNHQVYRRKKQGLYSNALNEAQREGIKALKANQPWRSLEEYFKSQNRRSTKQFELYLDPIPETQIQYELKFSPSVFDDPLATKVLSEEEIVAIAKAEHASWLEAYKSGDGVEGDKAPEENPRAKEWGDLPPEQQKYAIDYVRDMLRVIALADYTIRRKA